MTELKEHIIYESSIDCRSIKCDCGNSDCKIGLSFDDNGPGLKPIMRLQDKFGNEHAMFIGEENGMEIIQEIKSLIRSYKKNKYKK